MSRYRADVSAASIERIKRGFAPSEVEAAIATLARTEPGDDDLIHRILLRVSAGDLVALKRATWIAVRDWRDVVFAARNLDLEDGGLEVDSPEPPAPRCSPSPALARELVAAAESLRWAEALACSVEAGEVYVDHGDRAAELEVVGRHCDPEGVWIDAPAIFIVYRGVELPVPEEEYCVEVSSAMALATGWVRDGRHPDFEDADGLGSAPP